MPECPVCLQNYDDENTIPRVLTCGHTTCESCLKTLPQNYPQTVRCPACTQLVKFPSLGPSSLPKNIDLLRLIPNCSQNRKPVNQNCLIRNSVSFLWSNEFYDTWKNWILPKDFILGHEEEKDCGFLKDGNKKVKLFKVGDCEFDASGSGFVFMPSYVAKVMNFLYGLSAQMREELSLILNVCSRHFRTCKVCGFWGDLGDGFVYLVCERLNGGVLDEVGCFENRLSDDGLRSFAVIGMEICEAVIRLHLEGLFLGCLSQSCFELDDFGHVNVNFSEVLLTGREVQQSVLELGSGVIGDREVGNLISRFFRREIFLSPELFFEVSSKKENIAIECCNSSDVWSLACILLRLLFGEQFVEQVVEYVDHAVAEVNEEKCLGCSELYTGLVDKVSSLLKRKLGNEFKPLQQILCSCLNFDQGSRPSVINLWKCMRELVIKAEFDIMPALDKSINVNDRRHCLALSELSLVPNNQLEMHNTDESQGPESGIGEENLDQNEGVTSTKDLVEGILIGKVKVKDMQGHLDCVTGLAIGGGFLFSSSYDKSVKVWSLQEFSLIHTFKGHEHKVMAVTFVDDELPLCISGDSGGGLFVWGTTIPFREEPLKKWYEEKDWRYSGIQALTTAGNGYLYTGSGDRLVKAWSLRDGILLCTMEGHKSVVSKLAASNGVLYSGSWDGTIRLWNLTDHSLLTVLGEDMPRTATLILSLIAWQDLLVAAYENGHIKIWKNDKLMKTMQLHNGAIFSASINGKYLFTGGWDRTVRVQEISGDEFQVDPRSIGSIPGVAVVTSLLYQQGKLFAGYADKTMKVFYYASDSEF